MQNFVLLLIVFMLGACSQQSSKTQANFRFTMGALATPSEFAGGLVVYGVNASNSIAFVRVLDQNNLEGEVPNGTWSFFAIGWDEHTSGELMSGKVYCGKAVNMKLDGFPVEVNLDISNAKCAEKVYTAEFNESTEGIRFPKIEIETCNAVDNSMLTNNVNCDYESDPSSYVAEKGYAGSYRIEVRSFDREGTKVTLNGPVATSACVNVTTDSERGSMAGGELDHLNLPTGNAILQTPFQFFLRSFYAADCSDAKGYKDIPLLHGTKENHADAKSFLFDSSGTFINKIYAKTSIVDVCKDERLDAEFAAGFGTTGHPFVICNLSQFNRINDDTTKSFVLGSDLDFVSQTALHASPHPDCADGKENFVPIGGYKIECTNLDFKSGFSGNFDGLNHTISNIRLDKEANSIGLFRKINGGKVLNLELENAYIVGGSGTGAFVGECSNCELLNLTLKNSVVKGADSGTTDNIGGLVGSVSAGNLSLLVSYDSKVENPSGSNTGGIVGKLIKDSTLNKAIAENVQIFTEDNVVGGAIGLLNEDSRAEQIGVKGFIFSEGTQVGGVLGAFGSTAPNTLEHAYSQVYINSQSSDDTVRLGGIVGAVLGDATLDFTYSVTKIDTKCGNSVPGDCLAGCIVGDNSADRLGITNHAYCMDKYALNPIHGSDPEVSLGGVDFNKNFTEANLRTKTAFFDLVIKENFNGTTDIWTSTNGMFPRFSFEPERPCHFLENLALPFVQIAAGRGTEDNPVVLCVPTQAVGIPPASEAHYVLEEGYRIGQLNTVDNMIKNFKGVLNGKNKILYDLDITIPTDAVGLFAKIGTNGTVKNFQIAGAKKSAPGTFSGILVAENNGTIENVKIHIKDLQQLTGGVVGSNNGTIKQAYVIGDVSSTGRNLGGIAVTNNGTILESYSGLEIENTLLVRTGGIASHNDNGVIDQCKSEVTFAGLGDASAKVGAIAGINSGTIKNSYFAENGEMLFSDVSEVGGIGGIVGENTGLVKNTYSAGLVHIQSISDTDIGGITGSSTTSSDVNFSVILQNTVGNNVATVFRGDTFEDASYSCEVQEIGESVVVTMFLMSIADGGSPSELDGKSYASSDQIRAVTSDGVQVVNLSTPAPNSGDFSDGFSKTFNLSDPCPTGIVESLTFFTALSSSKGESHSSENLKSINTYTSLSWDIVEEDDDRVLNYYKDDLGLIDNQESDPVWIISEGEDFPQLFKLEDE